MAGVDPYRCLRARGGALAALRRPAGDRDRQPGATGAEAMRGVRRRTASAWRWRSRRPTRSGARSPATSAPRMVERRRDALRRTASAAARCSATGFTWRKAAALAAGLAGAWRSRPGWRCRSRSPGSCVANVLTMGLRLVAILARLRAGGPPPTAAAPRLVDYRRLPPVSILVPLKGEAAVARPAAGGAGDDGVSGAAARHQAGARGGRPRHPRRDRARRAAADGRGRHRAARQHPDQAAGDELRPALLPRRDRRASTTPRTSPTPARSAPSCST